MAPNVPALLEAHYGVPMVGAVLNALNIRLDPATIAFILKHGEAKILFTDREFSPVIEKALTMMENPPSVINIDDPLYTGSGSLLGDTDYSGFLAEGNPNYETLAPSDEWNAIALNYTSGTTGNPKGVVYHHRGAYLNAIGNALAWDMPQRPVYLWTLPMFHCNGWCFPWTIVALAGTHVCLRNVETKGILREIRDNDVTHFCGAPIVLNMLNDASPEAFVGINSGVKIMTAASPPPPPVLASIEEKGFQVTHAYGLTECYGPGVVCAWHDEWDSKPLAERSRFKARQGVAYPTLDRLMIADPDDMKPCPKDGETMGEVMMRGNIVMKGYLKNKDATKNAFRGGWFHTEDLGVMHPDGYIELKDRSKDIIISGGENISSIEIETVLYEHPSVIAAAVVARPDKKWGEAPCAFVELRTANATVTEAQMIDFCRDKLAHYKAPKTVVFGTLPKTSTGKIQKYLLRKSAQDL
tara:strand:+ start:77 stop:1483 length:1407 start_codon:yes stop_codon:yes gene_type:complete